MELETWNLNRVFLATSAGLLVMSLAVMVLAQTPFTMARFFSAGATCTLLAGAFVAVIAIRRKAPWLSWDMSIVLLLQTLLCAALGAMMPLSREFSTPDILVCAGWVGLVLVSGWGMFRNRWWGFFGEALACVGLATLLAITFWHPPTGTTFEVAGSYFWLAWGGFFFLQFVASLIRSGFIAWNTRNPRPGNEPDWTSVLE